MSPLEHKFIRYQVELEIEGSASSLDIFGMEEKLVILGTANEHEYISVQQISTKTGIDIDTVRKGLQWGIKKQLLSGSLVDDMFVRRHRMRKLHIEYINWIEEQNKQA